MATLTQSKLAPLSATRIENRWFGTRVTRTHSCSEHYVVERKRFWRRESAARWAQVWMDYRWTLCWKKWEGNYE